MNDCLCLCIWHVCIGYVVRIRQLKNLGDGEGEGRGRELILLECRAQKVFPRSLRVGVTTQFTKPFTARFTTHSS